MSIAHINHSFSLCFLDPQNILTPQCIFPPLVNYDHLDDKTSLSLSSPVFGEVTIIQ